MNHAKDILQHLFNDEHKNVKILLEMTGLDRRTIYDNLKKLKQKDSPEMKKRSCKLKFNSIDRKHLSHLIIKQDTALASILK